MNSAEIIRAVYQGVTFVNLALVVVACNNGSGSREGGNGRDAHAPPTNVVIAVETLEKIHEPTQEERFFSEFKQLVVLKRTRTGEKSTQKIINELCNEICALPKDQALPLLDQFADMAISQPITETNYTLRTAWFGQLFYVIHDAFCFSQYLQQESFEHWDKLFNFFEKYTDEITSVKRSLPTTDSRFWGQKNWDRGRYLIGIQDDLKQWVHVMRDFYFPELGKGLTEEQKADIIRRFAEVEKFTVPPPSLSSGKE